MKSSFMAFNSEWTKKGALGGKIFGNETKWSELVVDFNKNMGIIFKHIYDGGKNTGWFGLEWPHLWRNRLWCRNGYNAPFLDPRLPSHRTPCVGILLNVQPSEVKDEL